MHLCICCTGISHCVCIKPSCCQLELQMASLYVHTRTGGNSVCQVAFSWLDDMTAKLGSSRHHCQPKQPPPEGTTVTTPTQDHTTLWTNAIQNCALTMLLLLLLPCLCVEHSLAVRLQCMNASALFLSCNAVSRQVCMTFSTSQWRRPPVPEAQWGSAGHWWAKYLLIPFILVRFLRRFCQFISVY